MKIKKTEEKKLKKKIEKKEKKKNDNYIHLGEHQLAARAVYDGRTV